MMDNSRLEEIMKQDLTVEMQNELLEVLKESQLIMPVIYSENMFEGIENAKKGDVFEIREQSGFNINYLTDQDGNRILPLFTSDEMMEAAGLRSSAYVLFMSDLANLLKQTDNYKEISINPLTEFNLSLPVEAFLQLFEEVPDMFETLNGIIKILREHSKELKENYMFYLRSEDDFMKEEAIDGVFTPNIPFNISSREDFHKDMKYLNVIILPKTTKILFIGNVVDEDAYDTIIAPGSEFKWIEDRDEFTRIWECGEQPFYDE